MSTATLINCFEVSPEHDDRFVALWKQADDLLRSRGGYRSTRLHKNPLKSAGFVVLRAPDVPSVLVELGYMSDKEDLSHLTSADWRARNAASLSQAIDDFFAPRLVAGAGLRR